MGGGLRLVRSKLKLRACVHQVNADFATHYQA